MLCGVIAAALASSLVGVPAMRLRGLALAVSTLGFALAASSWLLRQGIFLGDGISPAKPKWWGYPLEYAVDYYLFALLLLCIGLWVTNNLRHGGFGRVLEALRDNEHAAQAFTVPNRRRMLQLYAVAGAVDNAGAIAAVEGIDCVFVGPNDLAANMGFLGQPYRPEVQERIGTVIAAVRAAGKTPGLLDFNLEAGKAWLDRGFDFLAVGSDISLLAANATALLKAYRG